MIVVKLLFAYCVLNTMNSDLLLVKSYYFFAILYFILLFQNMILDKVLPIDERSMNRPPINN